MHPEVQACPWSNSHPTSPQNSSSSLSFTEHHNCFGSKMRPCWSLIVFLRLSATSSWITSWQNQKVVQFFFFFFKKRKEKTISWYMTNYSEYSLSSANMVPLKCYYQPPEQTGRWLNWNYTFHEHIRVQAPTMWTCHFQSPASQINPLSDKWQLVSKQHKESPCQLSHVCNLFCISISYK